ncbi:MAG: hypothetical protein QOH24_424 [Verrucomicrobiota bacterium]|jgi:peptidoglycan hydrolase-like protein with peptidoglycan-binding domain
MRRKMKSKLGLVILLSVLITQLAFADTTTEQAQAALKEQGFYYGEITGQKDADTTAAIRRFQIRNGLQVTGELNDETLHALNSGSTPRTPQSATPIPQTSAPSGETANSVTPVPQRSGQIYSPPPAPSSSGIFSNTPYEMAPPELQRRVIVGAQTLLRRRGFYKGEIDGLYGPELELSLRAYQSRSGIPPNGRFDMDTLASLALLPGQQFPARELPRRRILPRRLDLPPVRGEWVPENQEHEEDD